VKKLPNNYIFQIFNYNVNVCAYLTYASNANTITDDVTKLVMHRVFNTNI